MNLIVFLNNTNCSEFKETVTFKELFEWLSEPEQVFNMVQSIMHDRPALEGFLEELEERFNGITDGYLSIL